MTNRDVSIKLHRIPGARYGSIEVRPIADAAGLRPGSSCQQPGLVTTRELPDSDRERLEVLYRSDSRRVLAGGTRAEGVGVAPSFWGMTEAEYREKADLWPLNPKGELIRFESSPAQATF